jgi:pyruvate/2-oxoglutarate dehydrogenase complex dihydrolipoamide acyltransferase (E2) component
MSNTESKKTEENIKTVKVDVAAVIAEVKKNGAAAKGPLADAVRAAAANLPDTEPPPPPTAAPQSPSQPAPPVIITVVRGIIG